MRVHELGIDGVLLLELERHADARGFFCERFHEEKVAALGIDRHWVQDNHSFNHANVLRGIHLQQNPAQAKLVGVIRGAIWDVAVDLRPESKSFGHYVAAELSEHNQRMLFIPEGFGHGFCVLHNSPADVLYKVSGRYNAKGEAGVRYDDRALAIAWPIDNPIISERDRNLPGLAHYRTSVLDTL